MRSKSVTQSSVQPTLQATIQRSPKDSARRKINDLVVGMIVLDLQPLLIVEDKKGYTIFLLKR